MSLPVSAAAAHPSLLAASQHASWQWLQGARTPVATVPLPVTRCVKRRGSAASCRAALAAGVLGAAAQRSCSTVATGTHARARHAQGASARSNVERNATERALIFDCDGVIAESEELHREAYNQVFQEFNLGVLWSKEYYDMLQNTVGGGKPKMRYHFKLHGWPASKLGPPPCDEITQTVLVDALQDRKTEMYKEMVASGRSVARPGILALIDEGLARPDVRTAICSASTKDGVLKVLESVLGQERLSRFDALLLGDDVSRKKPDPLIYRLASQRLGVQPSLCAVVEDSKIGLEAALGASMVCYITYTDSTRSQDFTGAREVVADATQLSLERMLPLV